MIRKDKASNELFDEVINMGLCCFCGGCSGGCPYLVSYQGRIALMDNCTLSDGQCYQYCPRTYTDMDLISQQVFGVPYGEEEIGIVKEIFLARSADTEIREKGQDGGVVTTLLSVALAEGIVDGVVETKMDDDKTPRGFIARNREELLECAGNSYEPGSALEVLNRLPRESTEKLASLVYPARSRLLAR